MSSTKSPFSEQFYSSFPKVFIPCLGKRILQMLLASLVYRSASCSVGALGKNIKSVLWERPTQPRAKHEVNSRFVLFSNSHGDHFAASRYPFRRVRRARIPF
uniref:Uncharacterized protein n=1 Tax=Compsopogon caeruleus TaxID=31354 RepID=A0A7S1TCI9_9RHOD